MAGSKICAVKLGRAAGKTKFTILDEESVPLVQKCSLEPRIIIDHNGNGTKIYGFIYGSRKSRCNARKLHEVLWELHIGRIRCGYEVAHRNGITVDNRIDNLYLVSKDEAATKSDRLLLPDPDSLYYQVLKRIPADPIEESFLELSSMRCYGRNGEIVVDYDKNLCFYECHYPPCSNIENQVGEYSACSHCRQVRYCGVSCQQIDWTVHKKHCCPERRKRRQRSISPER